MGDVDVEVGVAEGDVYGDGGEGDVASHGGDVGDGSGGGLGGGGARKGSPGVEEVAAALVVGVGEAGCAADGEVGCVWVGREETVVPVVFGAAVTMVFLSGD